MSTSTVETLFAEDQSFRQTWVWMLLVGILLMLSSIFGLILFDGLNKDGSLQTLMGIGFGIVVSAGVAVLIYTMKLSVRLDATALHIRFFPLVTRTIALADIAHWEARAYRPILEYGGWGIRRSWKGMAYNVSGNRGVQLELATGKRLLIGSQRSEELAEAIRRAKQHT